MQNDVNGKYAIIFSTANGMMPVCVCVCTSVGSELCLQASDFKSQLINAGGWEGWNDADIFGKMQVDTRFTQDFLK